MEENTISNITVDTVKNIPVSVKNRDLILKLNPYFSVEFYRDPLIFEN
jgi:hypothetical protein